MGAWFEAKIIQISRESKRSQASDKSKDTVKQVLSESNITPMDTNKEKSDKKDENENDQLKSTEDGPSTSVDSSALTPYDKLFDTIKHDGFEYNVIYEG